MKLAITIIYFQFLFYLTDPIKSIIEPIKLGNLFFHFDTMPYNTGILRVVLYNQPDQFLSRFGWCNADSATINSNGSIDICFKNIPFGNYAAAIYLDQNKNGIVDRNIVGLPIEAFGFSNNVKAKWSIPSYTKVLFTFNHNNLIVNSNINYWSYQ